MTALILELKSSDVLNNECAWVGLLKDCISERFNVAMELLEFRTVRVHDGVEKKRIDEITEHQNLLERHLRVVFKVIKIKMRKFYTFFV